MIKIKVSNVDTEFNCLEVKGHANSAEYGHDLVCAATSAVLIGGLNNLQNPKGFEIEIKTGYVKVKALEKVSTHDAIVIETIICGLKTIQEENSDFITIKTE